MTRIFAILALGVFLVCATGVSDVHARNAEVLPSVIPPQAEARVPIVEHPEPQKGPG